MIQLCAPNPVCNENRYTGATTVPRAQMSCISIGMSLTQMLLNDETRQLFEYKNNFDYSDTRLNDIFSGKNYQYLRNNNIIGDNDICDIPGIACLMNHQGHQSKYGCRICTVECEAPIGSSHGLYFTRRGSMRTKEELVSGNGLVSVIFYNLFRID
ncbi:hypothetical protein BD770DRAFT_403818 [Pilaira anomala]|nr:hypothetical protein BD770DRAFT_403818 [Pilaira anomala]